MPYIFKISGWMALLALIALSDGQSIAQTSDGIDPACSAPRRGNAVWLARAKLAEQLRFNRRHALKPESLVPTSLALNWDSQTRLPQLLLRGPVGQAARVYSTTAIEAVAWEPLLT